MIFVVGGVVPTYVEILLCYSAVEKTTVETKFSLLKAILDNRKMSIRVV
jgi:hypothetical protein